MGTCDQEGWPVRFEWGLHGITTLAPVSDVVIIVDVLRFTTTVTEAVGRGAIIFPFHFQDESVGRFAMQVGAEVVGASTSHHSLSPLSMRDIKPGTRVVLPSPNGSELSLAAWGLCQKVIAGSLRNARAVSRAAMGNGGTVSVVAAGERWPQDGTLRPCLEDLLGAGAILSHMGTELSPEARTAVAAFASAEQELSNLMLDSVSGRELVERGHGADVRYAAERDSSTVVPIMVDHAFLALDG